MKKIALLFLAGIMILSLTACGRRNEDMNQNNTTVPSTNQPETTQDTNATNIPDPTVNDNSTTGQGSDNGAVGDAVDEMMPSGTDNGNQQNTSGATGNK